jgi:TPR repeat protein
LIAMGSSAARSALAALLLLAGSARADLGQGIDAVARRDWEAALAQFRPLAEQGDPDAQVNLGNLYLKGYGVAQDYGAALRWYLKAAKQGSAIGQGKLGMMHYYGLGVREDHAAAAGWFRAAAEQGDAGAEAILGTLYEAGDGVGKDAVQAYFWYALAASHGRSEAQESRNALAERMSPGEIGEALGLLADWARRHPPPPVAEGGEGPTEGAEAPTGPVSNKKAAATRRKPSVKAKR